MACCELKVTPQELALVEFMNLYADKFSELVCNAENFEYFGQKPEAIDTYDRMSELWYMFIYSMMVGMEADFIIKKNLASAGATCIDIIPTYKDIFKNYNLQCMLDYFQCRHKIDAQEILDIFGIRTDIRTGIDWMTIENTNQCKSPFKIA